MQPSLRGDTGEEIAENLRECEWKLQKFHPLDPTVRLGMVDHRFDNFNHNCPPLPLSHSLSFSIALLSPSSSYGETEKGEKGHTVEWKVS